MLKKILFALIIAITMQSCIGPKRMQTILDTNTLPKIGGEEVAGAKNIVVSIEDLKGIGQKAEIDKRANYLIPAIFYWESKSKYWCKIGRANIQENIISNFNKSISKLEIDKLNSADYELLIYIDSIESKISYLKESSTVFLLLAYATTHLEVAGPSKLEVDIKYALRKGNEVIYENTLSGFKMTEPVRKTSLSSKVYLIRHLKEYFNQFNLLIEEMSSQIIEDIDQNIK